LPRRTSVIRCNVLAMPSSKELYSASEAARAVGISLDTLRRWDREGRINTERDQANRRLVPLTEIVRLRGASDAHGLSARHRFRGRGLVLSLIELPLVLPPAVAGIALLAVFGRLGLLGGTLSALGITISFTQTAVVLAVAYVESPLYLRGAIAAFEGLDPNLLDASRTLGSGPARTFVRVALPL